MEHFEEVAEATCIQTGFEKTISFFIVHLPLEAAELAHQHSRYEVVEFISTDVLRRNVLHSSKHTHSILDSG